jgi:hypothetical protein
MRRTSSFRRPGGRLLVAAAAAGVGVFQLLASGTAGAATPPGFTVYAAPGSLSNANNAGEPSVGVDWKTGAVMYQAYTSTYRITPPASGAVNWSDVTSAYTGTINLDPILWTDAAQGRTLAGGLSGLCSVLAASDNDGASWAPTSNSCSGGGWDHETVGGGPYANTGLTTPTHTFPDAVYYCSQSGLSPGPAFCARSDNGGLSFGPGTQAWGLQTCGGLHGHVKVAPNGWVYLPNRNCGGKAGVAISKDNGTTWSLSTIPGSSNQNESDPSIAFDTGNTGYECWQDGANNATGSTAKMASYNPATGQWGSPVDLGALVGAKNIQFPAAVAGAAGHAACAFLGTPTAGDDQASGFNGVWHLYVATSYDGGLTYQATDVTPTDPVQKGCIWMAGGSNQCRNLLDFMDAQLDKTGHIVVGFADGCTGSCATGGASNWAAYATIAYQTTGDAL